MRLGWQVRSWGEEHFLTSMTLEWPWDLLDPWRVAMCRFLLEAVRGILWCSCSSTASCPLPGTGCSVTLSPK